MTSSMPTPVPPPVPEAPRPDPKGGDATHRLLDRPAPPGYLEACARALAAPLADEARARASALAFRLGDERFLLASACVREVHVPPRVHRVPGRTNEVFRGVVCLRGEIHLCADLHALLGCARDAAAPASRRRTVVVERDGERWAFDADEVFDVHRYDEAAVAAPQVTVANAAVRFTDGLVALGERHAARLDPRRLFEGLARSLA